MTKMAPGGPFRDFRFRLLAAAAVKRVGRHVQDAHHLWGGEVHQSSVHVDKSVLLSHRSVGLENSAKVATIIGFFVLLSCKLFLWMMVLSTEVVIFAPAY